MDPAQNAVVVNPNHVDTLADLLDRARNGDVLGIAYSIITKDGAPEFGYAGAALEQPYRTIGILCLMEMEFAEIVRRKLRIVRT